MEEELIFTEELRQLTTDDPGHPDVFNPLFGQLLDNTKYLKKEAEDQGQQISDCEGVIIAHRADNANPHSVTKTQVGLGNVENVEQMPLSYLDTNTSLGTSNVKIPSQNAVKTYADTKLKKDGTDRVINTSGDSNFIIENGVEGKDALVTFLKSGAAVWNAGIDSSDGNAFKLANSGHLNNFGLADVITLTQSIFKYMGNDVITKGNSMNVKATMTDSSTIISAGSTYEKSVGLGNSNGKHGILIIRGSSNLYGAVALFTTQLSECVAISFNNGSIQINAYALGGLLTDTGMFGTNIRLKYTRIIGSNLVLGFENTSGTQNTLNVTACTVEVIG